jgi:hypothetical protein
VSIKGIYILATSNDTFFGFHRQVALYSAFTDKAESNHHFQAGTARHTNKCYMILDVSQVFLHNDNKLNLPILYEVLKVLSLYMHTFSIQFK